LWPGSTARMKPRAGAKKRKFSEWPESESSSKVIEFRNILYNNSPGVEFSLVNRIAIAKSLSPPPVVYDLDWNPMQVAAKAKALLQCWLVLHPMEHISTIIQERQKHGLLWS